MKLLKYHILALLAGYILDLIVGDPHEHFHPIRLIGNLISATEKKIYKDKKERGLLLVLIVLSVVFITVFFIIFTAYKINALVGIIVEAILSFYCLATKSLAVESGNVIKALNEEGIVAARKQLSMIVGRDTENLSEEEVIKAAVETVAENTADGVVSPMIYLCLGGPVLGFLYKAINTMDSMVGYKNDRYGNYGYYPARLDDISGYITSRISALLIVLSAYILPGFDGNSAFRIFKRDRYNHKSPNSAQSESAYAGAMGLKLAGGAFYFGKWVEKPYIGDEVNKIGRGDVERSHKLLYMTSLLSIILCMVAISIVMK